MVLALTTGAVNAVTFLRLGKVFSSVITGNLALLGMAAGQRLGSQAVNGGVALAGYGLGVVVGGVIAGMAADGQPVWPGRTTATLAAELLVLAGFSGDWLAVAGHPSGGVRLVLLAVAAAAMGMQSAAVRLLGHMSSTYLTSTLTALLQALATRRWPAEWERGLSVLVAFVGGAALGAAALAGPTALVPAVIMVPVAIVVICAAGRYSSFLRIPSHPLRRRGRRPH